MKYLKTFNELNEGLRAKMIGKSEEESYDMVKDLDDIFKIKVVVVNNMDFIFDRVVQEIRDNGNGHLINRGLLQLAITENSFDIFKKILNEYPELIPEDEDYLIDYVVDEIVFFEYYNFLEELVKCKKIMKNLPKRIRDMVVDIVSNYNVNEGLRDKMKPKSEDVVLNKLKEQPPLEQIKTIYKYGLDRSHLPSKEEVLKSLKDNYSKEDIYEYILSNVSSDNVWVVDEILSGGLLDVDINYDYRGQSDYFTLLHIAVDNESHDMAKVLLKHGADPNIKDANNLTAIELAEKYHDYKMINLFKKTY